ncbi:hypothetical protein [Nocardioides sp. GXQ0305]|uniref:hypothetical protein n=1 Tax=Nocardioides sp. GXQ0305 TaxID=3423912 RepID=UPI003D7EAE72
MKPKTITASVDGGEPEPFRLVDWHARRDWSKYPTGALFLSIDYRRTVVVLVEKPPRGRPAYVQTVAPLSESGDPEPGRITREDVLSLFREGDA